MRRALTIASLMAVAVVAGLASMERNGRPVRAPPDADAVENVDDAEDAGRQGRGAVLKYNVYAAWLPDGGLVPLMDEDLPDGGIRKRIFNRFPCAKRPTGTPARRCGAGLPDGGLRDPGDENVMQPGVWVGPGCVRTACVIMSGDPAP